MLNNKDFFGVIYLFWLLTVSKQIQNWFITIKFSAFIPVNSNQLTKLLPSFLKWLLPWFKMAASIFKMAAFISKWLPFVNQIWIDYKDDRTSILGILYIIYIIIYIHNLMILGFKLLCVIIFNAGRSEHLICVSLKYQSSCILNLSVHFLQ